MRVNEGEALTVEKHWIWDEYAPGCRSLQRPGSRDVWLFGMKWLPTVGARSRKLLLRQLRRERVRWWAGTQSGAGTVGFLPPATKGGLRHAHGRSAALGYAAQCPTGAHMLVLQFQQTEYWVVAVSEGNVLSQTDCWVESHERVLEIEATIRQRFGNLQLAQHDLCESDLATAPELKFLHSSGNESRVSLRRLRVSSLKELTLLGLMAVCLFIWFRQHGAEPPGRSRSDRSVHPASAGVQIPELVELSDPVELERVKSMWSDLPVDPPGWLLERVSCEWKLRSLDCRATYQRQVPGATNQHLTSVIDAGWKIVPVSIDATDATRSYTFRPYSVRMRDLVQMQAKTQTSTHSQGGWLTALQDLSALTYSIEVSQPILMADLRFEGPDGVDRSKPFARLDQSVTSPDTGNAYGSLRTSFQGRLQRRMVRLSLPLRHLSKVQASPITVRWKSMHLEVVHPGMEPARTTRLRVYLEGDLIDAS